MWLSPLHLSTPLVQDLVVKDETSSGQGSLGQLQHAD
jgi:hypothetical protein